MLSKDLLTAGVLTTLLLAVLFALPRENGLFRGSSRPTTMDGCCCCGGGGNRATTTTRMVMMRRMKPTTPTTTTKVTIRIPGMRMSTSRWSECARSWRSAGWTPSNSWKAPCAVRATMTTMMTKWSNVLHHLQRHQQQHPRARQPRKKPTGSWAPMGIGGTTIRPPTNGGTRTNTVKLLSTPERIQEGELR